MLTVHLRITDSASNRPTPARVSITDKGGQSFAPLGRFPEFPVGINEAVGAGLWMGAEKWFSVDGGCEIKLPAGVPLRFRVTKGPEFVPVEQEVTLGAGQMAVRLSLERWTNPAKTGWQSGDGRCHFLSPHAALLEAGAEGLEVVNLLATEQLVPGQSGKLYPVAANLDAFGGQSPTLEVDGRKVVVNTFNTHPVLGNLALLHAHRPVYPLAFGEDSDDWSLVDWCRQCHRKKGLVVWCDPFRPGPAPPGGEALIALVLGEVNAIECDPQARLPTYYRLLDAGFPVPLVGSSRKRSNKRPLGAMRTYAKLPPDQPLTYSAWIEAVRAGNTYVTTGPLVDFTVDARVPGVAVELAGPMSVDVRAYANSIVPFDRLELLCNSTVVASAEASCLPPPGFPLLWHDADPPTVYRAQIKQFFSMTESSWFAVRCVGPSGSVLYPAAPTFAHTSPVVVRIGGAPLPRRPTAAAFLNSCVEKVKDWATAVGRYTEPKWQAQLLARCDEASAQLTSETRPG